MVDAKHSEMQKKLKKDLELIESDIAITHDGWTSISTQSYSTVTGHFITDDWQLRSVVLQTTQLVGSHTAENISQNLKAMQQA